MRSTLWLRQTLIIALMLLFSFCLPWSMNHSNHSRIQENDYAVLPTFFLYPPFSFCGIEGPYFLSIVFYYVLILNYFFLFSDAGILLKQGRETKEKGSKLC